MVTRLRAVIFLTSWSLFGLSLTSGADDGRELRIRLNDEHALGADQWIYNDLNQAMARARAEKKPLFVTFRCVPCDSCASFDAEVAKGSEVIKRIAKEKFVAVRQVEMKDVDLSLFQFDHDLNWAAMFINANGVVYARYGTQSEQGPDAYNSVEGLQKTMERVLELHAQYPLNKVSLNAKRAKQKPYKTALEMPGLEQREKRKGLTKRNNCIHCHNIHDAENAHAHATGTFTNDLLWRYPLPDNVGLKIDPKDGIRILDMVKDSPALRAGLRAGENVVAMNGQPMTSIADMQWVLHHLPNADTSVTVEGSETGEHQVKLSKGWKKTDISWRGSMWALQPRLRVWTPELTAAERKKHGLADERALLVKWINRQSKGGRGALESGLREGDVIVRVAGKLVDMDARQFNVHIKMNYKVGESVPVRVLRGGKERDVAWKLVE